MVGLQAGLKQISRDEYLPANDFTDCQVTIRFIQSAFKKSAMTWLCTCEAHGHAALLEGLHGCQACPSWQGEGPHKGERRHAVAAAKIWNAVTLKVNDAGGTLIATTAADRKAVGTDIVDLNGRSDASDNTHHARPRCPAPVPEVI